MARPHRLVRRPRGSFRALVALGLACGLAFVPVPAAADPDVHDETLGDREQSGQRHEQPPPDRPGGGLHVLRGGEDAGQAERGRAHQAGE